MAKLWSIVIPRKTKNLCTNPSFEAATSPTAGYTAVGTTTLAQNSGTRRWGKYCMEVTPSAGTTDGFYYEVTTVGGRRYWGSIYLLGNPAYTYTLQWSDFSNNPLGTATVITPAFNSYNRWCRFLVGFTANTNVMRLQVRKNGSANTEKIYIDGVMIEELTDTAGLPSIYFDGDQDGAAWDATKHASVSQRSDLYTLGGYEYELSDTNGLVMQAFSGAGNGPVSIKTLDLAGAQGSSVQSTRDDPRAITLAISGVGARSAQALHTLRKTLSYAINPERTKKAELLLLYWGADPYDPLAIKVVYTGGMEFNAPEHPTMESIPLRVIGYDPYFRRLGTDFVTLTGHQLIGDDFSNTGVNYIVSRVDGDWVKFQGPGVGSGFNGRVYCMAVGPDGMTYFGGAFTTANGITVNKVTRWTGTTFENISSGSSLSGGDVYCMAFNNAGQLVVGGSFTSHKRLAKLVGTSFTQIGSGLDDGAVNTLYHYYDGTVDYMMIGGSFTLSNAVNCRRGAYSVANTLTSVVEWMGFDAPIWKITETSDLGIVVAGEFTRDYTLNNLSLNYLARMYANTWYKYGSNPNAAVYEVLSDQRGNTWIFGVFSQVGGLSSIKLARWDGVQWNTFNDWTGVVPNAIFSAVWAPDGRIYVQDGRYIFDPGTNTLTYIKAPVTTSGTNLGFDSVLLRERSEGYDLYYGVNAGSGVVMAVPKLNTYFYAGSAKSYPIIRIKYKETYGANFGAEFQIENLTTGAIINLKVVEVSGETIIIDLRPSNRAIYSDYRTGPNKNLLQTLRPLSQVQDFYLVPGYNKISVRHSKNSGMSVDADFEITMEFETLFKSVDGVA